MLYDPPKLQRGISLCHAKNRRDLFGLDVRRDFGNRKRFADPEANEKERKTEMDESSDEEHRARVSFTIYPASKRNA